MRKTLIVAFALALGGCRADAPESTPNTTEAPVTAPTPGSPAPRSGKIDLPKARPALPTDDPDDDRGATLQSRAERRAQRQAMFDTDGDGTVTEEEIAAARAKREAEMLARLDKDGDGKVSDEERTAVRRGRAESLHGRLDSDGDGKVTAAELAAAPFGRFDTSTADANNDGVISVDELQAAMPARGRGPWQGRRRGLGEDSGSGAGSGE